MQIDHIHTYSIYFNVPSEMAPLSTIQHDLRNDVSAILRHSKVESVDVCCITNRIYVRVYGVRPLSKKELNFLSRLEDKWVQKAKEVLE